jgi:hypothetical protein
LCWVRKKEGSGEVVHLQSAVAKRVHCFFEACEEGGDKTHTQKKIKHNQKKKGKEQRRVGVHRRLGRDLFIFGREYWI